MRDIAIRDGSASIGAGLTAARAIVIVAATYAAVAIAPAALPPPRSDPSRPPRRRADDTTDAICLYAAIAAVPVNTISLPIGTLGLIAY